MRHLLYLMFRCDVDVIESLELGGEFFFELNAAIVVHLLRLTLILRPLK